MKKTISLVLIALVISLIVCSKKKPDEAIQKISSAIIILEDGREYPFDITKITDKVRVITKESGNAVLPFDKERTVTLNANTEIALNLDKNGDVNLSLLKGEIVVEKGAETRALSITSDIVSTIGENCKYSATYYPQKNVYITKVFEGAIKIFPSGSSPIEIDNCKKVLIKLGGEVSSIISINQDDVDNLNTWLPNERKLALICEEETIKENKAPIWLSKMKREAIENEKFTDTAKAEDPEKKEVLYSLRKSPKNMRIDKKSGIITYDAPKSGIHKIVLAAQDEEGKEINKTYYLTVPGKVQAVLTLKEVITVGESIKIDAKESRNSKGKIAGLLYRFDGNGDGKWDSDFNNNSSISRKFEKAGVKKIKLEVKDDSGKKDVAVTEIKVVDKISGKLVHTPLVIKPGIEVEIKADISTTKNVSIRWDLNNDGKWDIPSNGEFGSKFLVKNIWEKKGSYKVKAELKNKAQSIVIQDVINIYDGIVIDSIVAPDTVNVNENVRITCYARDEKSKIKEYAWDFAGVGVYDRKTSSPLIETVYKKGGIYTIVCAVTNFAGMSASKTKEIIVVNAEATVAAGGPYNTTVNKEIKVKGLGRDPDSKISEYLWDLNFDGKFEIKNTTTSEATALFKNSGDYKIVFGIITDDGKKIFDTTFIKVSNRAPYAFAGEDIVSKSGKKVKLNGIGEDPDDNIESFEWDFNEDGKYDFSSKDSGYVEFKFEKFTKAVFKVTDKEGLFMTDTVRIIICPKDMVTNKTGKFCIDKFEYPNQRKKIPVTSLSQIKAAKKCAEVGKRLCKIEELSLSCKNGKEKFNYPYGKRYEEYNCNTVDSRKTDNRISWSGQYTLCVTKDGIFDMTGNVAEWVAETDDEYGYAIGGWWQDNRDAAACGKYVRIKKQKGYGHVGFRCCK